MVREEDNNQRIPMVPGIASENSAHAARARVSTAGSDLRELDADQLDGTDDNS